MRASLRAIEAAVAEIKHLPKASDFTALKADIAQLDGCVSQLPTAWTMFTAVVATWGAGAAIVFTLLRFAQP